MLRLIAVELIQQQGDVKRAIALYETSEQGWGWPAIAPAVEKTGDIAQANNILEQEFDALIREIEDLPAGDGRDFAISLLLVDVVLAQGFEQAFELVDKMQPFAQSQGIRDIPAGLAIVGEHSRMLPIFSWTKFW